MPTIHQHKFFLLRKWSCSQWHKTKQNSVLHLAGKRPTNSAPSHTPLFPFWMVLVPEPKDRRRQQGTELLCLLDAWSWMRLEIRSGRTGQEARSGSSESGRH